MYQVPARHLGQRDRRQQALTNATDARPEGTLALKARTESQLAFRVPLERRGKILAHQLQIPAATASGDFCNQSRGRPAATHCNRARWSSEAVQPQSWFLMDPSSLLRVALAMMAILAKEHKIRVATQNPSWLVLPDGLAISRQIKPAPRVHRDNPVLTGQHTAVSAAKAGSPPAAGPPCA